MKQVAENNKATFYTNHMTDSATEYAKNLGLDIRCFIAESKENGEKAYILVLLDNEIVYANPQYEAIAVRIDVLSLLNRDI